MFSSSASSRRFADQRSAATEFEPLVTVTGPAAEDARAFGNWSGSGHGPLIPTATPFSASQETPAVTPLASWMIRDGRYTGGSEQLRLELRVDAGVSRIMSADLFAIAADGAAVWLASLRTKPPELFDPATGGWGVIATDRNGNIADGRIALQPMGATTVRGDLTLHQPLEGLPWGRPIVIGLEWQGQAMRRLGLEIEQEDGVAPPPSIQFNGMSMSIEQALANAGIETWAAGLTSTLPPPPEPRAGDDQRGWSEKDLEGLMRDFAETPLGQPAFELRMLWLSRSNRRGLLGIMFDSEDDLQRQGLAVFADEIRSLVSPADAGRKLIQTSVHEIGHALNLAHRFERVVGRADSASFMNYDWRYKGGKRAGEFWQRFTFSFDEDELAFLRHGPLASLIPGGHSFHSVRYWAEGNGGYSPYLNEVPLAGLRLEILPPQSGAHLFAFGQPVLLGLRLTNTGSRPIRVPTYLLDAKAGFLEIGVRRLDLSDRDRRDVRSFTPIIARCFDLMAEELRILQPAESMSDNLNLTFGAAGFPFAEPGFYEVTAYLIIYDPAANRELVAPAPAIRIRVASPQGLQEERQALMLFSSTVGRYFALGGTFRSGAEAMLDEILDERLAGSRRSKKDKDSVACDGVAANIIRSRAFRLGRNYHGRIGGMVKEVHRADQAAALHELDRLDDDALAVFDPITAGSTERYRKRLRDEMS